MTDASQASGSGRRGRPGLDADAVLRRAIELFNTQGYDATSMGDLATSLGITKSAIYHHVPSKERLLELALDEALDELAGAVSVAGSRLGSTAATTAGTASERLRELVSTSVAVLIAHQPAVTLLLRIRGNGPVEQAALARRRRIDEDVAALVRQAMADGGIRDDLPPGVVSRLVFGMVNSLVEWYRPERGICSADLAEAITSVAFDGLVAGHHLPGHTVGGEPLGPP